jgi:hypothetical protein
MASVADTNRPTSEHKRCVNDLIHERSTTDGAQASEPVAFVCECASPACFQTVWMSTAEYDDNRLDADWVVLGRRHS